MFAPRNRADLTQSTFLESNDTSAGVGYAPYNTAHRVALELEGWLTADDTTAAHPYLGRDVKIMASYDGSSLMITGCVPFIADHTPSRAFYAESLAWVRDELTQRAQNLVPANVAIYVDLNTRDVRELNEVYLTATGSSIESGDEGVVGRGNRLHGVINFTGPMSLEAPHGKNPVYHVGKLYSALADEIATAITAATSRANIVHLVSQSGRDLRDPWLCALSLFGEQDGRICGWIDSLIGECLAEINNLSGRIIRGDFPGFH